jgi:hypothetical protein
VPKEIDGLVDRAHDRSDIFELALERVDLAVLAQAATSAIDRIDGESRLEGWEHGRPARSVGRGAVNEHERRAAAGLLEGDPRAVA